MILQQPVPPMPAVGDVAPTAVFWRSNGRPLRLQSLRGKIVVLTFTSYHCAPCREFEPKLEALAERRGDASFFLVDVDPTGDLAKLAAKRSKASKVELLWDRYDADRQKMQVWNFGNVGTPTTYVIGRNGRFASRAIQGDEPKRVEFRIEWAKRH